MQSDSWSLQCTEPFLEDPGSQRHRSGLLAKVLGQRLHVMLPSIQHLQTRVWVVVSSSYFFVYRTEPNEKQRLSDWLGRLALALRGGSLIDQPNPISLNRTSFAFKAAGLKVPFRSSKTRGSADAGEATVETHQLLQQNSMTFVTAAKAWTIRTAFAVESSGSVFFAARRP